MYNSDNEKLHMLMYSIALVFFKAVIFKNAIKLSF